MKLLNNNSDLVDHEINEDAIEVNGDQVVVRRIYNDHDHRLTPQGEASVVTIARYHEERRSNRVKVVFAVQRRFLQRCREIALRNKTDNNFHISRITVKQLQEFQQEVQAEVAEKSEGCSRPFLKFFRYFGFPLESELLLKVLDQAIYVCAQNYNLKSKDWFYYQDFCFYNTKQQSRWPFLRNKLVQSFLILILYWALTPIFFCHISFDAGVCQVDPTGQDRSWYGWMHALYFASVSMALVGYGGVSIRQGIASYKTFFGIVYIAIAMGVALFAFAAAAQTAFSPFKKYYARIVDRVVGKHEKDEFLHRRMRRYRFIVYADVFIEFLALNLLGVFVSRFYANTTDVPEEQWTWIESFYWTVMTTTKMGYGDIAMSVRMHWFQIFYLVLGTYFIGDAIGKLAGLRDDEKMVRRKYAWERRQITHSLVASMQCNGYDDKVDQYEFMIAALIALGKITSDDVVPIMDKFRKLSRGSGVITLQDIEDHGNVEDEVDEPRLVDDL